jgi:hypothetical protein
VEEEIRRQPRGLLAVDGDLTRRGPKEVAVVDDDAARGRQWRHKEVALLTWEMVPGNALCGEERTNRGGQHRYDRGAEDKEGAHVGAKTRGGAWLWSGGDKLARWAPVVAVTACSGTHARCSLDTGARPRPVKMVADLHYSKGPVPNP